METLERYMWANMYYPGYTYRRYDKDIFDDIPVGMVVYVSRSLCNLMILYLECYDIRKKEEYKKYHTKYTMPFFMCHDLVFVEDFRLGGLDYNLYFDLR